MSESNGNGTNGATAVADPDTAEKAIQAVANIHVQQRPFSIPAKLAAKLAQARASVGAVAKNGHNPDQNYSYVQVEDVVKEAGKALADATVVVMPPEPTKVEVESIRSGSNRSGKFMTVTYLVRVIDGETGEGYETEQIGMGTDYPGDKALAKAKSAMKKYFLADLLEIPLGDGSDAEKTNHNGASVQKTDSSPAKEKQKTLFKNLVAERKHLLPKPARKAIVDFVGGSEPKKGPLSYAIDQLINAPDLLEFAKECGWDGTGDEAAVNDDAATEDFPVTADNQTSQDGEVEAPGSLPDAEGEALVELCRQQGAKKGALAAMLRSIGAELPGDDELTDELLTGAIKEIPVGQVARFKQMVSASGENIAGGEVEPTKSGDRPTREAVDPDSPLGETIKRVTELGYGSEFGNVAWLMFNADEPDVLEPAHLNQLVATLERANKVGIQQSSIAALIRRARENNHGVEDRVEKFVGWISQKEENAAQVKAADDAHAAAETSQA